MAAIDQAWWVTGTVVGALAGSLLPWKLEGLDFVLTSLFVVLLVEQVKRMKEPLPYAGAALGTLLGTLAAGSRAGMVIGIAMGMAASGIQAARARRRPE